MTSPTSALFPDAQCREYLFFPTLGKGNMYAPTPLLLLFTSLPSFIESTQFHKMNAKLRKKKKKDYRAAFTNTQPFFRFQLCILSASFQLSFAYLPTNKGFQQECTQIFFFVLCFIKQLERCSCTITNSSGGHAAALSHPTLFFLNMCTRAQKRTGEPRGDCGCAHRYTRAP